MGRRHSLETKRAQRKRRKHRKKLSKEAAQQHCRENGTAENIGGDKCCSHSQREGKRFKGI